jgi:hypothetical protein
LIYLTIKEMSRRMEMSIDVEELHLFDGIASCANHSVNFKIGMSYNYIIYFMINRNNLSIFFYYSWKRDRYAYKSIAIFQSKVYSLSISQGWNYQRNERFKCNYIFITNNIKAICLLVLQWLWIIIRWCH